MARILVHITPMLSVKRLLLLEKTEKCPQAKEAQKIENRDQNPQAKRCLQQELRPPILLPLISPLLHQTEAVPTLQL